MECVYKKDVLLAIITCFMGKMEETANRNSEYINHIRTFKNFKVANTGVNSDICVCKDTEHRTFMHISPSLSRMR